MKRILGIFVLNIILILCIEFIEAYFHIGKADSRYLIDEFSSNPVSFTISAIIFAPLIEELAFRYPMVKGIMVYPFLIVSCLVAFVEVSNVILTYFIVITNVLALYFYAIKKYQKLPMWLISFYAISFVLIHLGNHSVESLQRLNLMELFFQFSSQILLTIIVTYIRMKYRFLCALLYHSAYNTFICCMVFLENNQII